MRTPQFNIRLNETYLRELDLTAEMCGISRADVVRRGIELVRERHIRQQAEARELTGGKRAAGEKR